MNCIAITGASRGIGFAIAEQFAQQGYRLQLCSRNEQKLYQAVERLLAAYPGIDIRSRAFDLALEDQAKAFASWSLQQECPDVLVNNTGIYRPGNISDEAEGVLDLQLRTNLYSAYHVTRGLLPAMIARQSGHIFNICSIAGLKAYPGGGAYSISKFALNGFSINLRDELRPHGIKVTTVYPGAVMTDSWAGFDNSEHRIMEKEDIGAMVYAASRLSPGACVEEIVLRPQLGDL
ncbi:SDR family oxidoreductase [Niabella terrae]